MFHKIYSLQAEGSQSYARLQTYFWDENPSVGVQNRPVILICPGGGYHKTSAREAEAVALRFAAMGYHTAILWYSVAPSRFPTALFETAQAVYLLRNGAREFRIDPGKVVVMGFSAGGHLAASYGVYWNRNSVIRAAGAPVEWLRPNGLILCYPVITADRRYWHKDSFDNLLGADASPRQVRQASLELQVGPQTPRTFIWHGGADTVVHPQNAMLFAGALLEANVPVELHLFEKGGHGLALANAQTDKPQGGCRQKECEIWPELARTWLENL